jgi:hypothetical protein
VLLVSGLRELSNWNGGRQRGQLSARAIERGQLSARAIERGQLSAARGR